MASKKGEEGQDLSKQDQGTTGTAMAAYDYGDSANAGFENQTREDYSIPFLGVLQGLSPQLDELEAAKPGMIINTVTNDLYRADVGVSIIPCATIHVYVEWTPREKGGGFVAVHPLDSDVAKAARASNEFGKITLPNGNDLIETYYVYGINVKDDGTTEQVVLAFTSTKIKVYKDWMTKARGIQIVLEGGRRIPAPLFAHRYRLKTIKQKNSKGDFFNWTMGFDGADAVSCRLPVNDPLFQEAVAFNKLVASGAAKAAYESQGGSGTGQKEDDPF